MTSRPISVRLRLLPNARTVFTPGLFKKIPRRRDFRRYLFFHLPTVIPLSIATRFFLFLTFSSSVSLFSLSILRARDTCMIEVLTGALFWNTNGTKITKDTERESERDALRQDRNVRRRGESSRRRKNRWLLSDERKRTVLNIAKVNNSRFSLLRISGSTGMAYRRRSATLNQRQFIYSGKKTTLRRFVANIKPKSTLARFEFLGNRRETTTIRSRS